MYFCRSKYGSKAFSGKTLAEAYDNLADEEGTPLEECIFYKSELIKVELQEVQVTKKVPVATKQTAKKSITKK